MVDSGTWWERRFLFFLFSCSFVLKLFFVFVLYVWWTLNCDSISPIRHKNQMWIETTTVILMFQWESILYCLQSVGKKRKETRTNKNHTVEEKNERKENLAWNVCVEPSKLMPMDMRLDYFFFASFLFICVFFFVCIYVCIR